MFFIFTFLQIQSASLAESKSNDDRNVETGQKMNAVCDNKLQPSLECTNGEEQVMDIASDYSINCEENAQNGKLIHDAMTKLAQKLQSHVRNSHHVSLPDNKDFDWMIFWRDISSQYIYSYSFHNNASTKPKFALKEATESISTSLFDFLMANPNFDVEQYVKTQSDKLYDLVCKPDLQDFVETKELELAVSQYLDNLTNRLTFSKLPNKLNRRQSNRDWRKATSETNDRNNIFGCYPQDFACNIV